MHIIHKSMDLIIRNILNNNNNNNNNQIVYFFSLEMKFLTISNYFCKISN